VTHTRPEVPGFCLVCRERFGGQKRPHQTEKDSEEPEAAVEKHFKRNDNPDLDIKLTGGSEVVLGGDVRGAQVEDLWLDDDEIEEALQLLLEKEENVGVVHQHVEDLQSGFGTPPIWLRILTTRPALIIIPAMPLILLPGVSATTPPIPQLTRT
jgi:hypothetical protein